MIALYIPALPTVEAILDWLEERGDVVRVTLARGEDGLIRGAALLVRRARA